jgi:hypothetical protein
MGYKRRGRLVFVSSISPARAMLACRHAAASGWFEVRAWCDAAQPLPAGVAIILPAEAARWQAPASLAGLADWADWLIALDADACALCRACCTRVRCYADAPQDGGDAASWEVVDSLLARRVAGMAGGMRLLEKMRGEGG